MALKVKDNKNLQDVYAGLETETVVSPVVTKQVSVDQPKVLNVVRWLSKTGRANAGAEAVGTVNEYLTSMVDSGYKLFNTHFIGENPEGIGVLFVLVLE